MLSRLMSAPGTTGSRLVLAALLLGSCRATDGPPDTILFADRAAAWGLDFVHYNGMSGEFYFAEMTGAGGALVDFDHDGDLDVFLVQGRMLGPEKTAAQGDRLYRNDLTAGTDGRIRPHFVDVTAASGLDSRGYGMGVAAGDFDNDGWTDLYVTNLGSNQLWHNHGDGTFSDVTTATGSDDLRWSTSAAFFDYDRDGWLDLFVVNYTDFRVANHQRCSDTSGAPDYCGPRSYRPETDRLLRNLGDSGHGVTFAAVSARAGILAERGAGLGVVTGDLDGDGWTDVYVANDQMQNHLWRNRGGARSGAPAFVDEALRRGVAVNSRGMVEASMGVDAGDVDGDGDEDLFVTHLTSETNTLYVNGGGGVFDDRAVASGMGAVSLPFTGFGTAFLDFDLDGWLDVVAVNGAVRVIRRQQLAGEALPLRQPNQLFRNLGGRFADVTEGAPDLALALVSRGAAVGDVDNDGDPDVLVTNNNGPAQLLVNHSGDGRHWLGLRLLARPGRYALGARAVLIRDGAPPLWRRVRSDGSYLVAHDPRLRFGLGDSAGSGHVEVRWPSGRRQVWRGLASDRTTTLYERNPGTAAGGRR